MARPVQRLGRGKLHAITHRSATQPVPFPNPFCRTLRYFFAPKKRFSYGYHDPEPVFPAVYDLHQLTTLFLVYFNVNPFSAIPNSSYNFSNLFLAHVLKVKSGTYGL